MMGASEQMFGCGGRSMEEFINLLHLHPELREEVWLILAESEPPPESQDSPGQTNP